MALTGARTLPRTLPLSRERGEFSAPIEDETVFFEYVGKDIKTVELAPDGGVILTIDQLTKLRELEGSLTDFIVKRREDNRYYVNLKSVSSPKEASTSSK